MMNDWVLIDNNKEHTVHVVKDGLTTPGVEKKIYKTNQVEFRLVYNATGKMRGYQLKYKYAKKFPKIVAFNLFSIFYNPRKEYDPKEHKLEIIYEDQVLRLLAVSHKSGVKDYMLVGRWRTESEAEVKNEESE